MVLLNHFSSFTCWTCQGHTFFVHAGECGSQSQASGSCPVHFLCESREILTSFSCIIRSLQNTSLWTGSVPEYRDAVCVGFSQRRCGENPLEKLQRVSSEDLRTPLLGQAVNQNAELHSALVFFLAALLRQRNKSAPCWSVKEDTSSSTGSESECRVAFCVGVLLGSSPSAVKHVHIVCSLEACECLNTLDRAVHLTAETCQLFVTSHSHGESIWDSTRCLRNSAIIPLVTTWW